MVFTATICERKAEILENCLIVPNNDTDSSLVPVVVQKHAPNVEFSSATPRHRNRRVTAPRDLLRSLHHDNTPTIVHQLLRQVSLGQPRCVVAEYGGWRLIVAIVGNDDNFTRLSIALVPAKLLHVVGYLLRLCKQNHC